MSIQSDVGTWSTHLIDALLVRHALRRPWDAEAHDNGADGGGRGDGTGGMGVGERRGGWMMVRVVGEMSVSVWVCTGDGDPAPLASEVVDGARVDESG